MRIQIIDIINNKFNMYLNIMSIERTYIIGQSPMTTQENMDSVYGMILEDRRIEQRH